MDKEHKIITDEIVKLLRGGSAHIGLKDALDGLPAGARGDKPAGLPYSIWQLVEHIRIAQWDMLQFSRDADHKSPKWPDGYWVKEPAPADDTAWENSLSQIENDLEEFIALFKKEDIYKPLGHGSGQTILREALQIADHTAYHISEIIVIRRLQGNY
ncbi:DinB family protein [Mucilaginibacter sp. UR6-11]|uniref:DinB family protein n=1 Tax=Mucilaginibacter sp. UR6-11 TaxID=1435644 RepID=UPI001E4CEEC5|nr:DinB family protein [Mucilaginibacter sp. UR6-11]MCC8424145.1 DinB family protein [Mucilaginibacter sp. UR6-11]